MLVKHRDGQGQPLDDERRYPKEARRGDEKRIENFSHWEPRDIPRPTTATGSPIRALPQDSLPSGQPEDSPAPWLRGVDADSADAEIRRARLPTGSSADAERGSALIRQAQDLLTRALRDVDCAEEDTAAARAHAAALEDELAAAHEQVATIQSACESIKASARQREDALRASLAADREEARLELEKAHAAVADASAGGAPLDMQNGNILVAENSQLRAQLRELQMKVEEQHKMISTQEQRLDASTALEQRRRALKEELALPGPKASFAYFPCEFLDQDFTQAQIELWTEEVLLPENYTVGSLKKHIIALIGLQKKQAVFDIVCRESGRVIPLQDGDLIPETAKGKREFYLRGFADEDLERWKQTHAPHKSRKRSEVQGPAFEHMQRRKSPKLTSPQRQRLSTGSISVFEGLEQASPGGFCVNSPLAAGDSSGEEGEVVVAPEAGNASNASSASASAPSAAEAVSRVVNPTQASQRNQQNFDAVTQAAPQSRTREEKACSREQMANIPGLKLYSTTRPKKPQPAEQRMSDDHGGAEVPATAPERQVQSARALERTFSRSPSWSERKARRQPAAHEPPPQPAPLPRPIVPMGPPAVIMGPPAVRARGVDAATSGLDGNAAGMQCRCVVRGKQARQALDGFDCEQCRAFYDATGTTASTTAAGRQWKNGGGASRHRFAYAPTSTPPGFWDLSFPHDVT